MTAVLGVDLASARWTFNGSALVHVHAESRAVTHVMPGAIAWPDSETPFTPRALAGVIHAFAVREDVRAVALDGPHAWRNPLTAAYARRGAALRVPVPHAGQDRRVSHRVSPHSVRVDRLLRAGVRRAAGAAGRAASGCARGGGDGAPDSC